MWNGLWKPSVGSEDIYVNAFSTPATAYLEAGTVTVHAKVNIYISYDDQGAASSLTHGGVETSFSGSDSSLISAQKWGDGAFESALTGGPVLISGHFVAGETDVWADSFTFYNPVSQYVTISTSGGWAYSAGGENHIFAPHGNFEFTFKIAPGNSTIIGGDNPPVPTPTPIAAPPPTKSNNIHAIIISGRSDPAKIVTSQNVTLTGGIVALGKDPVPPAAPNPWSTGLHIVPDEALLTGAKIPPLTPNIIDVRIVKHEVVGDFVAPGASPSP